MNIVDAELKTEVKEDIIAAIITAIIIPRNPAQKNSLIGLLIDWIDRLIDLLPNWLADRLDRLFIR